MTHIEKMRLQAARLADTLRSAFTVELMKLPKKIRTMRYTEFCGDYGGDLHAVRCRADVTIPSGAEVVVVDFDERSGLYDVAPCDVELRSPRAAS